MTRILLTTLHTALETPAPVRKGSITVEYVVGDDPHDRRENDTVILARRVTVNIVDGAPVSPLDLEPTRDACAARWQIRTDEGRVFELITSIPDVPTVEIADLPVVDPYSYAPVAVTPSLIETIDERIALGGGGGGGGGLIITPDPINDGVLVITTTPGGASVSPDPEHDGVLVISV